MKNKALIFLVSGIIIGLSSGCEKKPPPVVPEQVEAEMAAARAAYKELLNLNPPTTLTFHYRSYMKQAEDALEASDFEAALEAARKAREQAELARDVRLQKLAGLMSELNQIKAEIESLFLPHLRLINAYWDAIDSVKASDYENAKVLIEKLRMDIAAEKKMSYVEQKTLIVTAPEEYIRRWGDVRMYKEITPEGKLREIVGTVPPQTEVLYIRVELFSRDRTFYLVEIPGTGVQGWMAEQYVAPDRVQRK
jgi:hypothetical protein